MCNVMSKKRNIFVCIYNRKLLVFALKISLKFASKIASKISFQRCSLTIVVSRDPYPDGFWWGLFWGEGTNFA